MLSSLDQMWIRVKHPDNTDGIMFVMDDVLLPGGDRLLVCQCCDHGGRDVSDLDPDNIFVLAGANGILRMRSRRDRDGWTEVLELLSEFGAECMDEKYALACVEELNPRRTSDFERFEYSLSSDAEKKLADSDVGLVEDEKAILLSMLFLLTKEVPWLSEEQLAAGLRLWNASNPGFFESEIDPWLIFLACQMNLVDRWGIILQRPQEQAA